MLSTVWAVVRAGIIEPLEPIDLPEGCRILVTVVEDVESASWWLDGDVHLGPSLSPPEQDVDNPVTDP